MKLGYFVIGAVGSIMTGAGYLVGIILFGFALLLFAFGQFDNGKNDLIYLGFTSHH